MHPYNQSLWNLVRRLFSTSMSMVFTAVMALGAHHMHVGWAVALHAMLTVGFLWLSAEVLLGLKGVTDRPVFFYIKNLFGFTAGLGVSLLLTLQAWMDGALWLVWVNGLSALFALWVALDCRRTLRKHTHNEP